MTRSAFLLLITIVAGCASTPPARTPMQQQADTATTDETRATMEQLRAAIAADPSDGARIYTLAQFLDRAGDTDEALRWLGELERIGWTRGVNDHDFRRTSQAAPRRYRAITTTLNAREPHVVHSTTAFTIHQPDLIPEGITYDPESGDFFASSIRLRKIVRIKADGTSKDFIASGQDGIFSTLGMKVDSERHILWVASAATREMQGYAASMSGQSGVFAYDLHTGNLVTKVITGDASGTSLLNDLAILDDGSALITDTDSGAIKRVRFGSDSIETWLPEDTFMLPNGITTIAGEPYVYVADFRGIARVDIRSRSITAITTPRGETLGGIDGLVSHGGALIGIQNAFGKPRIVRASLDGQRENVSAVEILEAGNPLFDEPTTCVVASDVLYYFANPQLRAFEANYALWPMDRLRDIVVLKLPLKT